MRQKILIADDNRAITEVLKLNFDLLGYEVLVAVDGEDAENKFKKFKPDLMILDVMMPKKNGYKVCQELKSDPLLAKIPIILLTAKNLKEDVYWGYDSGADAYITKPYDPRQLELLVDQLIKEAATGRRSTAWTGLPDASRVEAEHKARLEAGAPSVLIELALESKASEAFMSKYGQPRFKDLVHRVAWQIYEIVRDGTSAGFLGQTPSDTFVMTFHPEEMAELKARADQRITELIRSTYDPEDQARGFITIRPPDEQDFVQFPLIAVKWTEMEMVPE